jgi:hypothetical protein
VSKANSSEAVGTKRLQDGRNGRGRSSYAGFLSFAGVLGLLFLFSPSMFAQQRQASTTLVLQITTAARVTAPALLSFSDPAENGLTAEFVARGSIQVEARLDKETSNEFVLADWKPAVGANEGACVEPGCALADADTVPAGRVRSASLHSQASHLQVRSRWSQRDGGSFQVASLNLSGLGVVSRNGAARDLAPAPGAQLLPVRDMVPGSAESLAQIPTTLHPKFGLDLEFSMPHAPFAGPPAGNVTITYVTL